MSRPVPVLTDRLDLRSPDPAADLDDLFAIFSDPAGWWYDPGSRHLNPDRTADWLPSCSVAERLGLTNYGLAVDPSDHQLRLAYADRPIDGFGGQNSN